MIDIHGGDIWSAADRYGLKANEIIDFSASINPIFSERIKDIVINSIESLCHYPDPAYKKLRDAISGFINISPENIAVGNGSTEFIYLIPRVLTAENVLIPLPSFSEYENAIRQIDANPIFLPLSEKESFELPISEVIDKLKDIQMLLLCSPHNPTGVLYKKENILKIIDECERRGIWVVIDEVFIEFVPDFKNISFVAESIKRKNLVVLRSLTKIFAIPGLRLGYVIGNADIIKKIKGYQEPWQVNAVASAVGSEILKETDCINESLKLIRRERDFLFSELGKINGLKLFPSMVNFILASLIPPTPPLIKGGNGGINSTGLFSKLASRGILIRDLSTMKGLDNRFFRFAVRGRTDNEKLIAALKTEIKNVC
jgi:threonine-phosphate decarboxylase